MSKAPTNQMGKRAEGSGETPFARFTRNMRALMAVPKKELDAKVAAQKRRRQRQRAIAKG